MVANNEQKVARNEQKVRSNEQRVKCLALMKNQEIKWSFILGPMFFA